MKISVITPWMGISDLLPDYLRATEGAELIFVDNGSQEEDAKALEQAASIYIRNEENKGFAFANNQGYARATGDVIVFLNSDVAGDAGWLKSVEADVKDKGLYGPSLQHQLVYGNWWPYLEGWCVGATKKTWETIRAPSDISGYNEGPWDARRYPGPYWEDNDLCLRTMEAQCSLIHTAWALQHKGGRSAGPLLKWGDTFEQNRTTYAARCRVHWLRWTENAK